MKALICSWILMEVVRMQLSWKSVSVDARSDSHVLDPICHRVRWKASIVRQFYNLVLLVKFDVDFHLLEVLLLPVAHVTTL